MAGGVGLPLFSPSSAGYGAPEWAYLAFVKNYNKYIRLSNTIVYLSSAKHEYKAARNRLKADIVYHIICGM